MSDFTSVWDDAGDGAEADQLLRAMTAARVEAAAYWPFLAAASNREDFVNRLALKDEEIAAVAERQGITFEALVRSLAEDFHALEETRKTAADDHADHAHDGDGRCMELRDGKLVTKFPPSKKEGARHLAIFKVTAADDSTAYYVVDEDTNKKVGGPYDDESAARAAISGGDVEGDNLTVSQGDGGDSDDGDSDPAPKGDDADADSDAGDPDDSDKGDENPFTKKESSNLRRGEGGHHYRDNGKCAYCTRNESDIKGKPCKGSSDSAWYTKKESVRKVAHDDESHYKRNFQQDVGSYGSHEDYYKGGKPHGMYDSLGSAEKHLSRGGLDGWPSGGGDDEVAGFNHCPSCDHVYSQEHPAAKTQTNNDHCPNCGDIGYHDTASSALSDGDPDPHDDYHSQDSGSEDNYGDPYGKMDAHRQHMQSSLFPVVALAEGEDPLQVVIEEAPAGEGEPEKPDEHNEQLDLTGSLVDRFRQVFASTLQG